MKAIKKLSYYFGTHKIFFYFCLLILCILPVVSILNPGLPITHDGQDHVARIANFYQNLIEGNFIPRWAANLNWDYGHPILEFLYPLPSYIASLFHFIGFSLVDSTKIVFGLGMTLSFVFMYLWLSQFNSKYTAILGAFLYTYAPYRLVDLNVRGDIGENLAFTFIPLTMLFIYKFYKNNNYKFILAGSISLALLILSHNAISLMALPFILFYCAYLIFLSKNRKSLLINYMLLVVLGFALSAFFWIPALLEGRYTLRNLLTKGSYIGKFVTIEQLLYGSWNYGQTGQFTVQLGLAQWISLIFSPLAAYKLFKNKNKAYILILGLIVFCLSGIFLMLPISTFIWEKIMLMQNFQFPWRFLTVTVISTSILSVFVFNLIPGKYQKFAILVTIVFVLIMQKDYFAPKGYQYKPESFYSGIYHSTTDTGESSPVWSIRFMEHAPKSHLQILDGKATVKEVSRISTKHIYDVNVSKNTLFAENTLYFPGWKILANAKPVNIQFQDPHYKGIMTFRLTPGSYRIQAFYDETKLRLFCDYLSILSMISILGYCALKFYKIVIK
jgi:uncharacterized membrane protein